MTVFFTIVFIFRNWRHCGVNRDLAGGGLLPVCGGYGDGHGPAAYGGHCSVLIHFGNCGVGGFPFNALVCGILRQHGGGESQRLAYLQRRIGLVQRHTLYVHHRHFRLGDSNHAGSCLAAYGRSNLGRAFTYCRHKAGVGHSRHTLLG